MHPSEIQAIEIARWLKNIKEHEPKPVLFLGSRAGGLFRSTIPYAAAQQYGNRSFNKMSSRIEQFKTCYSILSNRRFSRDDIRSILFASLKGLSFSETDIRLAELVQNDVFDLIISTNIDNMLTQALKQVGMKDQQDFQVFIPQRHLLEDITSAHSHTFCQLYKIFGDFETDEYNLFRSDFFLHGHTRLKAYLSGILKGPVILLGYDQYWDHQIDSIFPQEGELIYFINEENTYEPFSHVLQHRKGFYICGGEGSYERFVQALHWHLVEERSFTSPLPPYVLSSPSMQQEMPLESPVAETGQLRVEKMVERNRIFISGSGSPQDEGYLTQLQTHLAKYKRENLLDVWDATKIEPGTNRLQETQNALALTQIAILLVSADFIASDSIADNILPPLLQAASTDGAVILPVIIEYCVIEDTPLQQFQPFNSPDEPLSSMKESDRHKVWARLVRFILALRKRQKR